jgi:mannose-6-phosphate isomerase-like protein (cupin superfamily)
MNWELKIRPTRIAGLKHSTASERSNTMNDKSNCATQPALTIPPDDLHRHLALARSDTDTSLPHLGIVGYTYTILLTGKDTAGRYCLIDMHIPPGGGPPPHRQDFEESFFVIAGELEVIFRDAKSVVRGGEPGKS